MNNRVDGMVPGFSFSKSPSVSSALLNLLKHENTLNPINCHL
jgi:hypothetical protein